MSDTRAAMREFRFLDEKRKMGSLSLGEEGRWNELREQLGAPELTQPGEVAAGDYAEVPQGYYGEDGQWYVYPEGYDPQQAYAYALQQGYYGEDGQWYAYPEGYDPQQAYAYALQQGYDLSAAAGHVPQGYEPNAYLQQGALAYEPGAPGEMPPQAPAAYAGTQPVQSDGGMETPYTLNYAAPGQGAQQLESLELSADDIQIPALSDPEPWGAPLPAAAAPAQDMPAVAPVPLPVAQVTELEETSELSAGNATVDPSMSFADLNPELEERRETAGELPTLQDADLLKPEPLEAGASDDTPTLESADFADAEPLPVEPSLHLEPTASGAAPALTPAPPADALGADPLESRGDAAARPMPDITAEAFLAASPEATRAEASTAVERLEPLDAHVETSSAAASGAPQVEVSSPLAPDAGFDVPPDEEPSAASPPEVTPASADPAFLTSETGFELTGAPPDEVAPISASGFEFTDAPAAEERGAGAPPEEAPGVPPEAARSVDNGLDVVDVSGFGAAARSSALPPPASPSQDTHEALAPSEVLSPELAHLGGTAPPDLDTPETSASGEAPALEVETSDLSPFSSGELSEPEEVPAFLTGKPDLSAFAAPGSHALEEDDFRVELTEPAVSIPASAIEVPPAIEVDVDVTAEVSSPSVVVSPDIAAPAPRKDFRPEIDLFAGPSQGTAMMSGPLRSLTEGTESAEGPMLELSPDDMLTHSEEPPSLELHGAGPDLQAQTVSLQDDVPDRFTTLPEASEEIPLASAADFLHTPELLGTGLAWSPLQAPQPASEWTPEEAPAAAQPTPLGEPSWAHSPSVPSAGMEPVWTEPAPPEESSWNDVPVADTWSESPADAQALEDLPVEVTLEAADVIEEPAPEVELAEIELVEELPAPAPVQAAPVQAAPPPARPPPAPVSSAPFAIDEMPLFEAPPGLSQVPKAEVRPSFIEGEHRVIIHTVEGQVKRGTIRDLDLLDEAISLEQQTGFTPERIPTQRVKAVFFMLPNGSRQPATEGRKVRVTFHDGRQVAGFSTDFKMPTKGFFVVPASSPTSTARIFIFRSSVRAVVEE